MGQGPDLGRNLAGMEADNTHTKFRRLMTWSRLPSGDAKEVDRSIDWVARAGGGRGLLRWLEQIALAIETLVGKLVGNPLANLFYHTDTLAFYLLIVVAVTGVYLTVFYQFGYDASYESVAKMNRFPLSAVMRAVHRYASGGLMIFTLLHALRIFFQDRFRGARKPAWAWGVVMTAALWLAGIIGYLLVWDTRAQLIVQAFVNLLKAIPSLAAAFHAGFLTDTASEKSWLYMVLFLGLHVGLSALGGLFYWYHIQRLNRPKFFPLKFWMFGTGVLLVALALAFPAGLLPMADFATLPGAVPLDAVFLFYLPVALKGPLFGLVVGLLLLAALLVAVPWLLRRREPPRIVVSPELCTGCTLCAEDCPYGALTMEPRNDGSPYKQVAVVDQERCVACGICIGSCSTMALSLGERPAQLLWQDVSARLSLYSSPQQPEGNEARLTDDFPVRVVFACERHLAHGARPYLRNSLESPAPVVDGTHIEVIPLTCAAMAHPGLLSRTLEAGADEVQVVGCPPDDCANREGNLWLEERLRRERAPKLRRDFASAPILTTWLPPDQFGQALSLHAPEVQEAQSHTREEKTDDERSTWERVFPTLTWRNMVVGLVLVAILFLGAVGLTSIPYTPYRDKEAFIHVAVRHAEGHRLVLEVDEQVVWQADEQAAVLHQVRITPGTRRVRLFLDDGGRVLFDDTVTLQGRQILELTFDIQP
jgi:ferredoxin